jgi:uncharacterized Tic20 family protein
MSDIPRDPYDSSNPPPIPPGVTDIEPVLSSDAKNIAMLCHLLAFTKYFTGVGHILGPLIVWLWKKDDHPFVDEHGKESLNFQISMTIYFLISSPLLCIVVGFFVWAAIGVVDAVLVIIAGLKAANGEHYRYPMTIRFLK